MWRDIRTSVLKSFAELFIVLESEDTLYPLNDIDLFCLHHIFIPRINKNLTSFTYDWNNHRISTEHGRTQLHVGGLITEPTAGTVSSHPTPTLSASILIPEPREHVEVPESSFQPCSQVVDPLATCTDFGIFLFTHCTNCWHAFE